LGVGLLGEPAFRGHIDDKEELLAFDKVSDGLVLVAINVSDRDVKEGLVSSESSAGDLVELGGVPLLVGDRGF